MTTTDHASPSYSQLRPSSPSSQSSQASESHGTRKNRGVSSRRVSPQNRISGDMNEQSPLLEPRDSHDDGPKRPVSPLADAGWEDGQGTKSIWYLILLTLGGVGLQIAWSVETSYGSPYLLSLGLSKSLLALVWIAGPLSGSLVQPWIGLVSDNCRVSWGKRRPFIVCGAIATILSLMILALAREIVEGFLGLFGVTKDSEGVKTSIKGFAILFVYILDIAINVIQAGLRAYAVDCAPRHQQEAANAWLMRAQGLGNIMGFSAGFIDLPRYLSWLGHTQFRILCAIASFVMALTVAISCSTVPERNPQFDEVPEPQGSVLNFFKSLLRSVRKLPDQVRKVCMVQLFAWIGWFPFLFYITTYIGEIYAEPFFEANPHMTDKEIDKVVEEGTRVGAFALLIFAITTFLASVFLPFFIQPAFQSPPTPPRTPMAVSTPMSGSGYIGLKRPRAGHQTFSQRCSSFFTRLQIPGFTLRRAWMFSHLIFAALMWSTFFVRNTLGGTIIVALVGIPWALTQWAPFALISSEIAKREAIRRGILRPVTADGELIAAGEDTASAEGADQAGVVLGIHNVSISAPQVIANIVSSLIFRWLQKPRGSVGDTSVAWVLRLGGVCAILAAFYTTRVHEEGEDVVLDERGRRYD